MPLRDEQGTISHLAQSGIDVHLVPREPEWLWKILGDSFPRGAVVTLTERDVLNRDLRPILKLTELGGLYIDHASLDDEFTTGLDQLTTLNALGLRGCKFARLASLRSMEGLVALDLSFTDVSTIDVRGLTELETVELRGTRIYDAVLPQFATLPQLRTLDISGSIGEINTGITDKGLRSLENIPSLKQLFAYNTAVTDEGISSLQRANPNLTITWKPIRRSGSSTGAQVP